MLKFIIFVFLFLLFCPLQAQDSTAQKQEKYPYFIIQKINFEGNKRTKERIIRRELDIKEGDTLYINKLDTTLKRNQIKVFNTRLFVTSELILDTTNVQKPYTNIKIKLHERWYIFPIPLFELSDRNFNEWWTTYQRDFSRINYGINIIWDNFRGRKEKINILIQAGFTNRYSIQYSIPYINQKQTWGFGISASYSENKSIAYQTKDHKLNFVKTRELMRERTRIGAGFSHRRGFYTFQNFDLQWTKSWVNDTITFLNPNYFRNGNNTQNYFSFGYSFRYDLRDVQAYPLRGQIFNFNITKNGLGLFDDVSQVNQLNYSVYYAYYKPLSKKWFLDNSVNVYQSFQNFQPYSFASAFGYGESVMRGYELFVIDGQGTFVNRNSLKYELYKGVKKIKFIKARQFNQVPMSMYFVLFSDFGYVQDNQFTQLNKTLNNVFLYSYGAGIDFFTSHNVIFKLSYAYNRLGNGAFYLNFNADL
ncbi:MAG: hypothetical protein EAZ85_06245 [Bacteroidetes bacterium]|nr:MAG: hypothetical protein EAZ85_06245 [Bacteroidota bacterium]TAG88835.1 MAG: hypothetical protein EAZ20_07760 [Bacteroidota bacterium]